MLRLHSILRGLGRFRLGCLAVSHRRPAEMTVRISYLPGISSTGSHFGSGSRDVNALAVRQCTGCSRLVCLKMWNIQPTHTKAWSFHREHEAQPDAQPIKFGEVAHFFRQRLKGDVPNLAKHVETQAFLRHGQPHCLCRSQVSSARHQSSI